MSRANAWRARRRLWKVEYNREHPSQDISFSAYIKQRRIEWKKHLKAKHEEAEAKRKADEVAAAYLQAEKKLKARELEKYLAANPSVMVYT